MGNLRKYAVTALAVCLVAGGVTAALCTANQTAAATSHKHHADVPTPWVVRTNNHQPRPRKTALAVAETGSPRRITAARDLAHGEECRVHRKHRPRCRGM